LQAQAPTERNQQGATNRGKSLSPSLSNFCSQFAAIFRNLYDILNERFELPDPFIPLQCANDKNLRVTLQRSN